MKSLFKKKLVYSEAAETTLAGTTYANLFPNWNLAVLLIHESEKKISFSLEFKYWLSSINNKALFFLSSLNRDPWENMYGT